MEAAGHPRFTPTRVGTIAALPGRRPAAAVHPHARGDNSPFPRAISPVLGSPPRAWGQLDTYVTSALTPRFTPTRVGTMAWINSPAVSSRGSPPRAWGQSLAAYNAGPGNRFTPTRVGTIPFAGTLGRTRTVHPHARGDNGGNGIWLPGMVGSPPRAWGQLCHTASISCTSRFTPTRVGTITAAAVSCTAEAVHPHARGDNFAPGSTPLQPRGSPPRAWGQSRGWDDGAARVRFTPTRVGTIPDPETECCIPAVHPHARGDNDLCGVVSDVGDGSPPRAWGQCNAPENPHEQRRFTPTRVGTIATRGPRHCAESVHPHARGDNVTPT